MDRRFRQFNRSGLTSGRYRRRRPSLRRGAAVVEFAIAANLMFLLVFSSIELARLNIIRNLAQDAAYFGARAAIVPGASIEDATAEANRILGTVGTQGVVVTVNDGATMGLDTNEVEVQVRVPLAENLLLIPVLPSWSDFVATARMKTERYENYFGVE